MKETISITRTPPADNAAMRQADKGNKVAILKNCAQFSDWISEINSIQADNSKDLNVAMYNLKEYSDKYSKKSERLRQ